MNKNWKTYLPTIIPAVVAVAGVIAQAGQSYLSAHPHATAVGFVSALGLAIWNHWIQSPKQS